MKALLYLQLTLNQHNIFVDDQRVVRDKLFLKSLYKCRMYMNLRSKPKTENQQYCRSFHSKLIKVLLTHQSNILMFLENIKHIQKETDNTITRLDIVITVYFF